MAKIQMLIVKKKPVKVKAIQVTKDNIYDLLTWFNANYKRKLIYYAQGERFCIQTLEGTMCAPLGDYIIIGVKGEAYPIKREIFESTYDIVDRVDL